MIENLIFYGIPTLIVIIAMFCFKQADRQQNNRISYLYRTLGINIVLFPLAFLIGGFATDSGDLSLFWKGFFFVQGIPLMLLFIGIIRLILKK